MGIPEDYIYNLHEAFALDRAASEVQRLSNLPSELPPEQANSRKAILTVAWKLITAERDKHINKMMEQFR